MREINSVAWWATYNTEAEWIPCHECAGTKHLRVLLPDDTVLTIPCAGCACGYDPPTGHIRVWKRVPRAKLITIQGFEFADRKESYHTQESWRIPAGELFNTETEALAAAKKKAADADAEERKRISEKEKPTRTWAWHVHYHRHQIRRAEKEIAYHSAKLGIAVAKTKEPV